MKTPFLTNYKDRLIPREAKILLIQIRWHQGDQAVCAITKLNQCLEIRMARSGGPNEEAVWSTLSAGAY